LNYEELPSNSMSWSRTADKITAFSCQANAVVGESLNRVLDSLIVVHFAELILKKKKN